MNMKSAEENPSVVDEHLKGGGVGGAKMAKFDVERVHTYRTVPVHPEDRWLLGMEMEGRCLH